MRAATAALATSGDLGRATAQWRILLPRVGVPVASFEWVFCMGKPRFPGQVWRFLSRHQYQVGFASLVATFPVKHADEFGQFHLLWIFILFLWPF